jgi:transcriptional regulator with XRE-family HTH domain
LENSVRVWRKKRGLKQKVLASTVGVSVMTIQHIESGRRGFTATTLQALAQALECKPADLLDVRALASVTRRTMEIVRNQDADQLRLTGEIIIKLAAILRHGPQEVRKAFRAAQRILDHESNQLRVGK